MKATREELLREAESRMKILGLDYEGYIEPLIKDGKVMMTEEQFVRFDGRTVDKNEVIEEFPNFASLRGILYQIFTVTPSEERIEVIERLEKDTGCLVYHVTRVELHHNDEAGNKAMYFYNTISGNKDDWEIERACAEEYIVCGFYTPYGYPQGSDKFLEYGEFKTANCCYGCLGVYA